MSKNKYTKIKVISNSIASLQETEKLLQKQAVEEIKKLCMDNQDIYYILAYQRYFKYGWDIEKVFSTPIRKYNTST